MKTLLILWAIGLAGSDKLDRTYLPPPGSISAGGHSQDLNLPLEFPRENYPSNLKPGSDRIGDSLLRSKYPNIAPGIDRQGAFATPSPKFTKQHGIFASKNIYSIPTTTGYDLAEPSTFSPFEAYVTTVGPVTTVSQGSSSTSIDPNVNYNQYFIQQNLKPNQAPQLFPKLISGDSVSNVPNKYVEYPSDNPSPDNAEKYESRQRNKIVGVPNFKQGNVYPISTNLAPQISLKNPLNQDGGDLGSISEAIEPTANTSYFDGNRNQPIFNIYNQRIPNSDDISRNSQEFYDPSKPGLSSTISPDQTFVEKLVTNMVTPFTKYPSTQIGFNNFDESFKPQRVQAEGDRNAVILNYENILTPDGFAYSFDTSNGIHADESGTAENGVKAKGSYSFTGDDGKIYTVEYTADESGFLPRGEHLPTAPPIPNAILKAIENAEKNKILGIVDDGSYDDGKYGHRRYQGLMDRIPENQYNSIIISNPSVDENEQDSEMADFGRKLTTYNTVNGGVLDKQAGNAPAKLSMKSKIPNAFGKIPYVVEDDNYYGTNQPTGSQSFSTEVENFSKTPIIGPENKYKDIESTLRKGERIGLITPTKSDALRSMVYTNVTPKDFITQQENHTGYKYTLPQNTFNDVSKNTLGSNIQKMRKDDESNPDDEKRDDKLIAEDYIIPNASFNFRNQRPGASSSILRNTYNNPVTVSDVDRNGNTESNIPALINREPGKIKYGVTTVPDRSFSTLQPKASTIKPYEYKSPYTSTGNGQHSSTYPSSTLGSQYSTVSTTPLPKGSSSFNPSTNSFSYSATTPVTSQVTSTLRPSSTLGRLTSGSTSKPAYTGRTSEPGEFGGSKISTMKPNFRQKIIGRPAYTDRTNNAPITKPGSEDTAHGIVDLTDPRSQNVRVSSRPGGDSDQATNKLIGEDFSGPKQSQRFDPKYGYYY